MMSFHRRGRRPFQCPFQAHPAGAFCLPSWPRRVRRPRKSSSRRKRPWPRQSTLVARRRRQQRRQGRRTGSPPALPLPQAMAAVALLQPRGPPWRGSGKRMGVRRLLSPRQTMMDL